MKGLTYTAMGAFIGISSLRAEAPMSATIQSPVYGTGSPPANLTAFWKGMRDVWWKPDHPDVVALNRYSRSYARGHDVAQILPSIFEDLKRNGSPDELRIALYSALVRKWDRRGG
jgi:hypothetical protein